jgi:tripartite-type tricarboxylate transporter receptor subunit TctC
VEEIIGMAGICLKSFLVLVVLGGTISGVSISAAQERSAKDPQSKTLALVVSESAGGSSDRLARLVGRFIGRHLPGNPAVIVRNMPGAGGLAAANYLYNVAPRDGGTIGMIEQSVYAMQLFKTKGLLADVRKFNWLGRVTSNNAALIARSDHLVQKIDDAFKNELVVSATGLSSQMRWNILKKLTGVKFRLIVGHQGTSEASLALERREIDAYSAPWIVFRVTRADWLRDRKVNILLQTGLDRASDLPDVPRVVDLARDDEQRQMLELFSQPEKVGRSLVAPPETPVERVAELRAAFTAMFRDADFQAELATQQLRLEPLDGEALQDFIFKSFGYAPELIEKAEALAKPE